MIKKDILISVIVPIYNAELYLEKCIKSILSQTYEQIEVILVDDGSTDKSDQICDFYALIDSRIQVVHQNNKGLQESRAVGINKARGEYIGFVDADDWIDEDMYEKLISKSYNCDIVTSGLIREDDNGRKIYNKTDSITEGVYLASDTNITSSLFSIKMKDGTFEYSIINAVWCKLFRTSILQKLISRINIGVSDAEDFLMTRLFLLNCNTVSITHEIAYHYCVRGNTMIAKVNSEYLSGWSRIYNCILNELASDIEKRKLIGQLQIFCMYHIFKYSEMKLGIDPASRFPRFVFPNDELIKEKRIILYGAGNVGMSYYKNWSMKGLCEVVLWVDENAKNRKLFGKELHLPIELLECTVDYDYVICATANKKIAEEMEEKLDDMGIDKNKVIFEEPINIIDKSFLQQLFD